MILFKEVSALTNYINKVKKSSKTVGFVPTMGALHQGHISLINISKSQADISVCSIFVNPTQFNDAKDFEKYPITIGNDVKLLEAAGCDVLFFPSVKEIYPNGVGAVQYYHLGEIENLLEGKYRPGHFQGVCQVVHRLLNIVSPNYLFMGQKDYQQVMVIRKLVHLENLPVEVISATTLREEAGLAMSSRNLRLTTEQKKQATAIATMLTYLKNNYKRYSVSELQQFVVNYLLKNGFTKVDYVSLANAETLEPVNAIEPNVAVVALIAAFIGEVRLIDNMILTN